MGYATKYNLLFCPLRTIILTWYIIKQAWVATASVNKFDAFKCGLQIINRL